jgi:myo-inositol catabolism protein IolC
LRQLSDYLARSQRLFMFELLVPPMRAQLERIGGARSAYDREVRPKLMVAAIEALQQAGVEPDVWKIEGLDRREECERVVDVARRDGRTGVACIVLGRGSDAQAVSHWLSVAASVPGFIGFAVGRTTWLEAITEWARPQHRARGGGWSDREALSRMGRHLRARVGSLIWRV